jgi:hypothetical protein
MSSSSRSHRQGSAEAGVKDQPELCQDQVTLERQASPEHDITFVPLAGAYSNPHAQEQIAHLYRLVSQSSLEDPNL